MLRSSTRVAFSLLLSLALAACGPSPTPSATTAPGPYADGIDHSWIASTAEGQRLYSALSQGLKAQNLGLGLSITASNGWGPIEVNTSNGETAAGDGRPISLKGKTYATGLGVHADSEIHIKATGLVTPACTRFKADIGIDDEVGENGKYSSVVFQVYGDGEKLYDSGLVTGSTPTKSIDVAIGNKSDLRFVVTKGPDQNYYDHADWAGASLNCATVQPPIPSGPPGTLDPSFDGDGIVTEPTGIDAAGFVQLPDGKLVVSGLGSQSGVPPYPDYMTLLVRYNTDGSLDSTFGTGGKSISNLRPVTASDTLGIETASGLTLLPDGKLLLASSASSAPGVPKPMLARYARNGTLDTSFGVGGTVVVADFINGSVRNIILLPDGQFLVNGYRGVQRYAANGNLDVSFGAAGTIERNDEYSAGVVAIARQSGGQILILKSDGYLKRYTENGQLDTGFGSDGTISYEVIRVPYETPGFPSNFTGTTVLVLPDDRFLVALRGRTFGPSTSKYDPPKIDDDSFLMRHNPDGSFDTGFGQGGKVVYTEGYSLFGLRLLSDGRLLSYPFRFNSDGNLDFTYTPLGFDFRGVQADGKLLLSGGPAFTYARIFP